MSKSRSLVRHGGLVMDKACGRFAEWGSFRTLLVRDDNDLENSQALASEWQLKAES